ncbi:hypothetical protein [Paenibacillus lemnae]|uniref:Copper resistance protein D domain-containing protein n=1 Tax=Paenibacillus lemnae TaxID=1330551 RepID=A0A848M0G7_PAELE|nr:hypothetical protein [Paenibacillus lemnae]NMO94398.1 hypothetical protein [Paenibacillus lemnae]
MFVFIRGLAAGRQVSAHGHEHIHAEGSLAWMDLFGKLVDLIEIGSIIILIGINIFRAAISPVSNASGGHKARSVILKIERAAAIAALYIIMLTASNNTLTLVKITFAIIWLLIVWEEKPYSKFLNYMRALCALILVIFLHEESIQASMSLEGLISVLAASIQITASAIWFGGALSTHAALSWKTEPPHPGIASYSYRFMIWSTAALCCIVLSGLLELVLSSNTSIEWISGQNGIMFLIKMSLSLFIVYTAAKDYRRWKETGDHEASRFSQYKQSLLLTLSLMIFVLLISVTSPSPVISSTMLKEPIYWHVMGEDAHMTLRVRDHSDGKQNVTLSIWLPSGMGQPNSTEVVFQHDQNKREAPMIYMEGGPDPYGFEGFDKYTYEADGNFIIDHGSWTMDVRVTDEAQQEHNYNKTILIP